MQASEHYHERPTKFHRAPCLDDTYHCTLPPSCWPEAQSFACVADLEAHQDRMHRWMCRVPVRDKPGRIGEGATVLVPQQFYRHYTETHDPIAREKLERGEKIFECFLPLDQCTKVCLTPKKRRHHLIDKHGYPNTYYFGITCHGLNRITREDGPAASLIRPFRAAEHGHGATPGKHHAPPHPPSEVDMEDLTARMGALESSLAFVPRNSFMYH
ncbi:hypothetical protein CcaverHIS002_0205440 [Cutaneotrichosporon cavernicola]|nr:hypothetical protein CcaverHIS002_0205440 [Cutaneotrichosporon cavernicola]